MKQSDKFSWHFTIFLTFLFGLVDRIIEVIFSTSITVINEIQSDFLAKGDWYDVFSLPIVEPTIWSWKDPFADVEVVVVVFYSMDSTLTDAERKLAGTLAAYHLLTLDGEA